MYKGVGIRLHVGAFVFWIAGTLYIGLGTVADQVIFLAVLNIGKQALVVLGAAGFITVICHGVQGVHGVRSHTALHASAHAVADQTRHQLLF